MTDLEGSKTIDPLWQRRPIKKARVSAKHSRPSQGFRPNSLIRTIARTTVLPQLVRRVIQNGTVILLSVDTDENMTLYYMNVTRSYMELEGRTAVIKSRKRTYPRVKDSPSYNRFMRIAFDAS